MNLKRLLSVAVLLAAPVLIAPTMASASNETGGRFSFVFSEGTTNAAKCGTRIASYAVGTTHYVSADAQCFDARLSPIQGSISRVDLRVTTKKYGALETSKWISGVDGASDEFSVINQLVSAQARAVGSDGTVYGAYTMELSNDMRTATAFNKFSPVRAHLSVTEGDSISGPTKVSAKVEKNIGSLSQVGIDCRTSAGTGSWQYTDLATGRISNAACPNSTDTGSAAAVLFQLNGLTYVPITFAAG